MLALLFTLLVNFFVLSTAQDLQFAQDVRDPIYAQMIVDSNGGVLQVDPSFAYVHHPTDFRLHPDIEREVECARHRLAVIQLEINDPVAYWWPDLVVTHDAQARIDAVAPTWRHNHIGIVLELVVHSRFISYHDMGMGREVAHPSYSSGADAQPSWGYQTNTFIRFGVLPSDRSVVSLLSNVNEPDAEHPQLLIGTVQYQDQTALADGQTQIYRMLGPLLELMTVAERHENYDTLHDSLAEIAVLLFATNGTEANPSICGCLPNKMTGGQTYDEDG